jgi:hypothetical protein
VAEPWVKYKRFGPSDFYNLIGVQERKNKIGTREATKRVNLWARASTSLNERNKKLIEWKRGSFSQKINLGHDANRSTWLVLESVMGKAGAP